MQQREEKWGHENFKDNDRSPSPDDRDHQRGKGGKGADFRGRFGGDRGFKGGRYGDREDRGGKGGRYSGDRDRRDIRSDRYQPSEIVV